MRLLGRKSSTGATGATRALIVFAAFYLALIQALSVAHAASGAAAAPNHHSDACALCATAGSGSAGLPTGDAVLPQPTIDARPQPLGAAAGLAELKLAPPQARGPPAA